MDQQAKKVVLRHLTYGLYAVTAEHLGERGIFTANWVTQVSFDPPLVALSVERDSSTLPLIRASGLFSICPFSNDQRELAAALGRPKARAGNKFETLRLPLVEIDGEPPALANTLGVLICQVHSETSAGDSVVLIAAVIEARVIKDGVPLEMRAAGFRHAG